MNQIHFLSFFFFCVYRKKEVEREKSTPERTICVTNQVSPCKSDDSGYSSGNSFDDNPKVEALVSNLNQDFIEKKSIGKMGRGSANFKALRSRINRNLIM